MTGFVLFALLRKLFSRLPGKLPGTVALMASLLFMAHPIHTEVVANIKGRDSMLELLFLLLSAYSLFCYLEHRSWRALVLSVACFFPALLSKESAIAFVVMVPVILILFDDSSTLKKTQVSLYYLIPVMLFLWLYYRYSGLHEFQRLHLLDNALSAPEPPPVILATKLLILGKYILLLVFPHPLVYDYSYLQIPFTGFSDPMVWLSILFYSGMLVFLSYVLLKRLAGKKAGPAMLLLGFSIAWFIMGFFASSNLLFLIGSTMAERFMYSPSLGYIIALAILLLTVSRLIFPKPAEKSTGLILFYVLSGCIVLAYMIKTVDRNKDWKDDYTLFSADIRYLGNNVKANDFLADAFSGKADKETDPALKKSYIMQAIELKEHAVAIYPKVPEIQQRLGYLYGEVGLFEKAAEKYSLCTEMNPSEIYNYIQLGKAYGMLQQPLKGIPVLERGLKLDPGQPELLTTLGIAYAQTGRFKESLASFEKALDRDPKNEQIINYVKITRQQLMRH